MHTSICLILMMLNFLPEDRYLLAETCRKYFENCTFQKCKCSVTLDRVTCSSETRTEVERDRDIFFKMWCGQFIHADLGSEAFILM